MRLLAVQMVALGKCNPRNSGATSESNCQGSVKLAKIQPIFGENSRIVPIQAGFDRQTRYHFTEVGDHFCGIVNFDLLKAFILCSNYE